MDKKYATEEFLVRWMAGELSQEELDGFLASDVHRQLVRIDQAMESLEKPEIDVEKALALVTAKNKNTKKETPVRKLWWLPAIAASVALLFGAFNYFLGNKTYQTGIGEKEIVLLADGSTVELNANSKLSFKRFGWEEDRAVEFEGEAFFDVRSGKDFTVKTTSGTIKVLGTQFNVRDRKNIKIQCYEGTIIFAPTLLHLAPFTLNGGNELISDGATLQTREISQRFPDWKEGFSAFVQQPFSDVLEELALQFPITLNANGINTNRQFSGKFSHNNLESALKTTMEPMGIKYHISEDKRIVTLSN